MVAFVYKTIRPLTQYSLTHTQSFNPFRNIVRSPMHVRIKSIIHTLIHALCNQQFIGSLHRIFMLHEFMLPFDFPFHSRAHPHTHTVTHTHTTHTRVYLVARTSHPPITSSLTQPLAATMLKS